jgi:hypothetical protein
MRDRAVIEFDRDIDDEDALGPPQGYPSSFDSIAICRRNSR